METNLSGREWLIGGRADRICWSEDVWSRLMEEMRAGFRRYPWGGVELGGILVGSRENHQVRVEDFVLAPSSHEYGPSFQLSDVDKGLLREALTGVERDGSQAVGWCHSVSNRQDLLSSSDDALITEFFPQSWQFALVIRRAKQAEPVPTLFVRTGGQLVRTAYAIVPLRPPDPGDDGAPPLESGSRMIQEQKLPAPELAVPEDLAVEPAPPSIEPPADAAASVVHTPVPPPQESPVEIATENGSIPDSDAPIAADVVQPVDPFTLTPNTALFYPSKQHREAIEGLWNGIRSRKGFLLLSADSGMGKTMVLECLMDRLRQEKIEYGLIFNSRLAVGDLFEMLRADFGLETAAPTKTSVLIALNTLLLKIANDGKTVALLIDDAHQLSNEVLEEIELLSNLETRQGKLLQVIFAARPEFEVRLGEDALRGLRSRVMRRFRLGPLSEEETAAYIGVRISQKQQGSRLLPESLFNEIHQRTGGVPRMITTLCGAAIERCEEADAAAVDHALLDRVASEFGV